MCRLFLTQCNFNREDNFRTWCTLQYKQCIVIQMNTASFLFLSISMSFSFLPMNFSFGLLIIWTHFFNLLLLWCSFFFLSDKRPVSFLAFRYSSCRSECANFPLLFLLSSLSVSLSLPLSRRLSHSLCLSVSHSHRLSILHYI